MHTPRSASRGTSALVGGPRTKGMTSSTAVRHANNDSRYHTQTTLEQVNYLKDLEKLRKELDRKDARQASSIQEMATLRIQQTNQERELRLLSGTFEKCNNERQRLSNEVARNKEYTDKLELQLVRLGNIQGLTTQVDDLHSENEHLSSQTRELNHSLSVREERIHVLEKELEAHQRSLELQSEYGKRSTGNGSGGNDGSTSDATMRSLYYELGKRQTDAHSLAVALASSNQDLQQTKEKLHNLSVTHADLQNEYENIRRHAQSLTQQSVSTQDEISHLMERLAHMKAQAAKFSEQASVSAMQLQDDRLSWDKIKIEQENEITKLTTSLQGANKENTRLKARVESMQNSITHIEGARAQAEERYANETRKLEVEKGANAEKARLGSEAKREVNALKQQLKDLLLAKDQCSTQQKKISEELEDYRIECLRIKAELEASNAREEELLLYRETTVKAFQQTIDATHVLSARANEEKIRRTAIEDQLLAAEQRASAAEKLADSLHKAREHVSSAVLESLQKEKAKNTLLEQRLEAALTKSTTMNQNNNSSSSRSSNSNMGFGTEGGGFKDGSFDSAFDAHDLFAPPLPPKSYPLNQSIEVRSSASVRSSGSGADVLKVSQSSVTSTDSQSGNGSGSGSAANDVKAELQRIRQELQIMEAKNPN